MDQLPRKLYYLSSGVMPIVRGTLVTPGVAFDLSVNRESSAFMGSILEADVNSRVDFIPMEFTGAVALKERAETINEIRFSLNIHLFPTVLHIMGCTFSSGKFH